MKHRKLNVCFLINELAPGGAQTLLLDIIRNTDSESEIEYTVCYIEGGDALVADLEAAGARVVDFGAEFKFDLRALWRMARFFQREEFDILHAHLPYTQTLGRIFGRFSSVQGIVSTQHSIPSSYHPITRTLERITRPLDSRTIAVSKAVERAFTGNTQQYEPEQDRQWCTIYNGIDVNEFETKVQSSNTADIRSEWGIDDELVFLSVGRYAPQKAQHILIEAMAHVVQELPNSQLLIVGSGERRDKLRNLVCKKDLEKNVHITGRQHSVHPYYRIADAFALSSAWESFGIVLLEAMATALPVVATDVDGIPEVVNDGQTGELVPPHSPQRLADAMIRLSDPERRERFGNAGYKRIRDKFSIERTVGHHLRLYKELCASENLQ